MASWLAPGLAVLAIAAVAAPAAANPAALPDDPSNAAVTLADGTITVGQEYRLTPAQPGRIDIQWRFRIPDSVTELRTTPPKGVTDIRAAGFVLRDGEYVWKRDEQSTTTPTLTFTQPVNVTGDRTGPIGTDGRLLFVDAGDWALIRSQPTAGFSYRYRAEEPPAVAYRNATAGPGIVGDGMVFLGPHTVERRRASGQILRLVVPEAATLGPDRQTVLESVAAAADSLRVGDRDGRVLMIAAPATVDWGVRGLQTGDSDFYVRAVEPVADPENVWIHEYVHTRQDYTTADSARWLAEASAEYYASLLTLDQERITYPIFREDLRSGTARRFDDVVLERPSTWTDNGGNYEKGALVAGALDRRLRLATDRTASFQTVFRDLNRQDGRIRAEEFLRSIEDAGATEVRDTARRFTETTATPNTWTEAEHAEVFGPTPPRFSYTFAGGLRTSGPYRNRTVSGPLVLGETAAVEVGIANVGGSPGTYDLQITRNGEVIATRSDTLGAGANTTESVATTFTEPGEYVLSTGSDRLTVEVREPATPAVTDLRSNRTAFAGGAVTVTATVANDAAVPARGVVTIGGPGEDLLTRQVRLDTGATAAVTATAQLTTPGRYRFTAGNRSVTVTVEAATITPTGTTAGADGPGFGLLAMLVATWLLVLIALHQRRA